MEFYIRHIRQYYLPIPFARPLSFGRQRVDNLEKLRVALTLEDSRTGRRETGWGEVPLNYPWFWPGCPLEDPSPAIRRIGARLGRAWENLGPLAHPLVAAAAFQEQELPGLSPEEEFPFLGRQVLNAAFDMALYDAAARLMGCGVYDLFSQELLPVTPDYFFRKDPAVQAALKGFRFEKALRPMPASLGVWHMVGTLDALEPAGGEEGLAAWIRRGGITRLKIKLSADPSRDLERLREIDRIAAPLGVEKFSLDYNGPGKELDWLVDFLGALKRELPGFYRRLAYVEQPVAAGITGSPRQIAALTAEKDLLVDEGAANWEELARYYRSGWSGAALKICKSQTSSLLMFALSKVQGKRVTVMDLTNPSLAQIAHVQLAARLSDEGELESNGIQYCPRASEAEAAVHPGLFTRRRGRLDLSSLIGEGYAFRIEEMAGIPQERTTL